MSSGLCPESFLHEGALTTPEIWKAVEDRLGVEVEKPVRWLQSCLVPETVLACAGGWDADGTVDGFTRCRGSRAWDKLGAKMTR